MPLRETRRFKTKGVAISFGDFMLPLVGLVAIGLLFVAGQVFFFSDFQTDRHSTPVSVAPPDILRAETEGSTAEASSEPTVAQALSDVTTAMGPSAQDNHNVYQITGNTEPAREVIVISPELESVQALPTRPVQTGTEQAYWMVQVGAFSTRAAAETVLRRVTQGGYRATIYSGRVWHRVLVYAGPTNQDASRLAATLGRSGYPGAFTVPPIH